MLKQYILVDENGFVEDVVLLDDEDENVEITQYHISTVTDGLYVPKWNFQTLEWEESLPEEEIEIIKETRDSHNNSLPSLEGLQRENELLREENRMNSLAIMELAELIFGIGDM